MCIMHCDKVYFNNALLVTVKLYSVYLDLLCMFSSQEFSMCAFADPHHVLVFLELAF